MDTLLTQEFSIRGVVKKYQNLYTSFSEKSSIRPPTTGTKTWVPIESCQKQ